VIISKENRSFDEYFGRFPGANGATTATKHDGTVVPLAKTPDPTPNDVQHDLGAFRIAYDNGKNDGFDLEQGAYSSTGQAIALSQMSQGQIPNYWSYASKYGLGDDVFSDWKGVSFGNNLFLMAGQSGQFEASQNFEYPTQIPLGPGGQNLTQWWGCDDPTGTKVSMATYPAGTSAPGLFPCFGFQGMPNVLAQNSVTWKVYSDPTKGENVHNGADALSPIRNDPTMWANVVSTTKFQTDATSGNLPSVSWVISPQSEHVPFTACAGMNQTTSYVNAIMNGPQWSSTAIFVIWDEWGGFYDHVPPPQIDSVSYGFRVPFLVISPWSRVGSGSMGGYISHNLSSQSSILKFISDNWSVPYVTPHVADASISDLMDYFDFSGPTGPKGKLKLAQKTCPTLSPALQRLAATEDPD